MPEGLLDTLVKLASLGASGVCIFAIFWIGWLILQLPPDATRERHISLRMFMIVTVIIAVISGATGFVNAKFKADEISKLENTLQSLESQLGQCKSHEIEMTKVAEALGTVLKSKEAYNLEHPSEQIETHINLLKSFLKDMGVR